MSVIHTVEAACDFPGCDEYVSQSYKRQPSVQQARRNLRKLGWSWVGSGATSTARCPEHFGRRKPEPTP